MTETPKEAAKRLAAGALAQGYRPQALHVYTDIGGEPVYWRIRAKHDDGRKWIRPMKLNGHGYELGEPEFPNGKPLYRLHDVVRRSGEPIWIVEGETCVDALARLGVLATTSGSATSATDADWTPLQGRTCALWPDNDEPGKAYCGEVAQRLLALGCSVSAVDVDKLALPEHGDAVDWLATRQNATRRDIDDLPRLTPAHRTTQASEVVPERPRALTRRLADIEARPIRWLWPGRIARGKVSMIAGHPGLGKSQLTAALAAVVSTGGKWPVDRTSCERGSVILLNAEDDAADTIRPRLEAAGADLGRCEMLDAVADGYTTDGEIARRGFSLKTDLRVLEELLASRNDVALVTIDPVTAYLSGVDSHVNADVRALLAPLGELAARHGVAVVCVSHLNKGGPNRGGAGEALMRVSGSLAFVAAARAAFIVARDPDEPSRRLFLPAKNNIGKDETGLAFSVESHVLPSGIETSRVLWEPEPVSVSADEAMAPPAEEEERTMTEEAADLLQDMLQQGRVLARDVKNRAKDAGLSEKALRMARTRLRVVATREGFGAETKTFWSLPGPSFVPSTPIRAHTRHRAQMDSEGTNGGSEPAAEPSETF